MATKKAAVRAPRAAPARVQSKPAARPVTPVRAPDGTLVLVHHGGATLNFRDGSGAKRRVLRGVSFVVDAATATLLLATDAAISVAEADDAPAAIATPVMSPVEAVPDAALPSLAPVTEPTVPLPPAAPPASGPGAITLGDLPPSARRGGL